MKRRTFFQRLFGSLMYAADTWKGVEQALDKLQDGPIMPEKARQIG